MRGKGWELIAIYQLRTCARGLRESVPIADMSNFYTCGIPEVGRMRRGGQCVEEGHKHLHGMCI